MCTKEPLNKRWPSHERVTAGFNVARIPATKDKAEAIAAHIVDASLPRANSFDPNRGLAPCPRRELGRQTTVKAIKDLMGRTNR